MGKSYRRFTVEEIIQCKTDNEKMNDLLTNCQAMISKISSTIFLDSTYDHADKMQIASMGVIRAVNNFNVKTGVDFYTYCYEAIRKELLREVQKLRTKKRGGRGEAEYKKNKNETSKAFCCVNIEKVGIAGKGRKNFLKDKSKTSNPYKYYIEKNEGWSFLKKELRLTQQEYLIFTQYYLDNKPQNKIAQERNVSRQRINTIIIGIEKKIKEKYTYEELFEKLC